MTTNKKLEPMDYVKSSLRFLLLLVAGATICIAFMEALAWLFGLSLEALVLMKAFTVSFVLSGVIVWLAPYKFNKAIGDSLVVVYYIGMSIVLFMGIYCLAKQPLLSKISMITMGAMIPYVVDIVLAKVQD